MFSQSKLLQSRRSHGQLDAPKDQYSQHRAATLVSPSRPNAQPSKPVKGWQKIVFLWQRLSLRWTQRSQLSIQKITNARRDCWWHVTDPSTNKSFYAETLSEAVDWIEAHRLGK